MDNIQNNMKKSWFLKWILALGIVVVMNLLFNYGFRTFYKPAPVFDDFCKQEQITVIPDTQEKCVEIGGGWTANNNFGKGGVLDRSMPKGPIEVYTPIDNNPGWCDTQFTCRTNFESATSVYNRNAFIALVALGILAVVASFFILEAEAVSLGLSLGGVVSIIIGSVRYWSNMDDKLRFGVLLVGFITLIWLGIRKIRD